MPYDETPPTPDEWRRALDAALAFRDAAPWTWMTEENMFGVQNPETGVTYYACVLGELGEMTALALYEGAEGLNGLWRMRTENLADPMEALILQRCLMVSFEDREVLEPADRDVLKSLGIKVRGRGAWPMLRSYLPGYAPWRVTGAQARFLALALEQALAMAGRFGGDPALLPFVPPGGAYLVRTRQGDGTWADERRVPEAASEPETAQEVVVDTERLSQLKETLPMTRGVLEMDFFLSPNAIQDEDGGRPFFPVILMAADQDSGLIVGNDLSRPDVIAQDCGEMLLTVLENVQMRPARVETSHVETRMYLEPFAGPLGVQVSLVPHLRAIQPAMEELALMLGGGFGLDLPGLLGPDLLELDEPEPSPRRLRRRASRASDKAPASVYQLKITLRDSKPPIWRRILVPGNIHLNALHDVIQATMGWTNSHLHAFEIDGEQFGPAYEDLDLEMHDECRAWLDEIAPVEGGKFVYEYDFGDSWRHTVLVEKILPFAPEMDLPVCVKGRGACPPEDCGGVWGYAELIEVMKNPKHPDYKEMKSWLGGKLDPEAFSLDEVNRRLRRSR